MDDGAVDDSAADEVAETHSGLIHRRSALLMGLAALAFAALPGCNARQSYGFKEEIMEPEPRTIFVLVHGAWHGGWCWDLVRHGLEQRGHKIFTPTLTGLGSRVSEMGPDVGLRTHIDDVVELLETGDLRDVILVGHSYGGMVITGAADRASERIRHMVYLDAALPEDGQSMVSYGPPKSEAELAATITQLRALAPDGLAMLPLPPELLGVPTDHPLYDWLKTRLTPHPLKSWLDPITLDHGGATDLLRTYIHCIEPVLPQSGFPYIAAQVQKNPEWQYFELKTGHDAMVTAPDELIALLANIPVQHPRR